MDSYNRWNFNASLMLQQYWKLSFPAQTLLVPEQAELLFVTASISTTQKQEGK